MPASEKATSPSDGGAESGGANPGGFARTRRSAAVASKQAWQILVPHKKGTLSGEEDDGSEYAEKPTPKEKRKKITPIQREPSSRKRPRATKAAKAELPDSTATDDEENVAERLMPATPPTAGRKPTGILARQQQQQYYQKQQQDANSNQESLPQKLVSSPAKQPKISASSSGEGQKQTTAQPAATSASQKQTSSASTQSPQQQQPSTQVIRPKASILGRRTPMSQKAKPAAGGDTLSGGGNSETPAADAKPRALSMHQQMLLKSGAGALNKEQLEEIEREVEKHGLDGGGPLAFRSNSSDGRFRPDDSSNDTADFDDYPAREDIKPARGGGASSRARGGAVRAVGGTSRVPSQKGIATGSRGARGGRGIGTKRGGRGGANESAPRTAGSVMGSAIVMNQRPMMNGGAAYSPSLGANGTVKVLRIRPSGAPSGPSAMMSGSMQPSSVAGSFRPPPVPYSSMFSGLSREIGEVSEKYSNRVVPGTTVQEFNNIIDLITQELSRVVDDKTRLIASHREYVDQLSLAHAAELDIKDKKIEQLENTVDTLQAKLMVAFKRIQLNALKNDTAVSAGLPPSAGPSSSAQPASATGGSQQLVNGEVSPSEKVTNEGAENSVKSQESETKDKSDTSLSGDAKTSLADALRQESRRAASLTQRPPVMLQHQKMAPRQLQRRAPISSNVNAFRYYEGGGEIEEGDEMEDDMMDDEEEDEFEGGVSASRRPAILSKAQGGGGISGPGGGSIFKAATGGPTGQRIIMPMSLNVMNKQRVVMRGYDAGGAYSPMPPRRLDPKSGTSFMDEEEDDDEMDDEEEFDEEEKRHLARMPGRGVRVGAHSRKPPNASASYDEEDDTPPSTNINEDELVDGGEVGATQTVL